MAKICIIIDIVCYHFRCDFVHGSVIAHQKSPPCEGG